MQKILIIDDEPRITQDILTFYGYNVDIALNGVEGMQKLVSQQPAEFDMVVLDINMPMMNGWSVLKAIRNSAECPDIPIIMLTSCDEEESIVAGLRRGVDEYLTKPITPSRLLAHVESIFRRAKWARQPQAIKPDPKTENNHSSGKLLTHRESEILKHLVQGLSNQEIGKLLVISETTVKNHLAHIFKKLNVSNRTQAAFIAQKLSLYNRN